MNTPQTELIVLPNSGARRLPLYFLLDFSSGVRPGFASETVRQVGAVISQLGAEARLKQSEYNQAPVFYTIIVFRSGALQLQPLAPAGFYPFAELHLEQIERQGERALGAAWMRLKESVEQELNMPGADNGDHTPLVFLFTDTMPAAEWLACQAVPGELFTCGSEPPAGMAGDVPGPIRECLPLVCQWQILARLEVARQQLKCRPHMIDYPLNY
jgi:hypothetical protein